MNKYILRAYGCLSFVWKNCKPIFESDDEELWMKQKKEYDEFLSKIDDAAERAFAMNIMVAIQEYIGLKRKGINYGVQKEC